MLLPVTATHAHTSTHQGEELKEQDVSLNFMQISADVFFQCNEAQLLTHAK
jgi:hypothetical protein